MLGKQELLMSKLAGVLSDAKQQLAASAICTAMYVTALGNSWGDPLGL